MKLAVHLNRMPKPDCKGLKKSGGVENIEAAPNPFMRPTHGVHK